MIPKNRLLSGSSTTSRLKREYMRIKQAVSKGKIFCNYEMTPTRSQNLAQNKKKQKRIL